MKKVIIITLCVIFLGLLTWAFIYDINREEKDFVLNSDIPGVDIVLTDDNFINCYEKMKSDHQAYIGKIICYEGFVNNNGDVCFVGRALRDNQNNRDIVYGMECRFKDDVQFEDDTWLRIYGVLDEDTEDLTGKTYLYVIVAKDDWEVIDEGMRVIAEVN